MSAKQLVGPYSQPEFRAPDQPQLSEPCHVGASKLGERSPCFPAAHLRKPLHRTSLHNMHHSVEYMEAQLEEGSRFRKVSTRMAQVEPDFAIGPSLPEANVPGPGNIAVHKKRSLLSQSLHSVGTGH